MKYLILALILSGCGGSPAAGTPAATASGHTFAMTLSGNSCGFVASITPVGGIAVYPPYAPRGNVVGNSAPITLNATGNTTANFLANSILSPPCLTGLLTVTIYKDTVLQVTTTVAAGTTYNSGQL